MLTNQWIENTYVQLLLLGEMESCLGKKKGKNCKVCLSFKICTLVNVKFQHHLHHQNQSPHHPPKKKTTLPLF